MIDSNSRIYFLGIGGIGMSALARYFNKRGHSISGYDRFRSDLCKALESEGLNIHYEDRPNLIPEDVDVVIYTPAISKELMEYKWLREQGIRMYKRSEVLGFITSRVRNIAVAGTHGKTTTSSIMAHLLHHGGLSFTAFLGGILSNYDTNYLDTGDDWMLEEADEYDRSFLHLRPDIAVLGSLDADHLDIYGTRDDMISSYIEFVSKIKDGGLLLCSDTLDNNDLIKLKGSFPKLRIRTFGFNTDEISVKTNKITNGWHEFEYITEKYHIKELSLRLPGQHNIRNAAAAIFVAMHLGLTEDQVRQGLKGFKGIHRRFQWCYETENLVLIDDYAHHPEELRSAIQACRSVYPERKITGIFQPHLYSRTRDFMDEFAKSLEQLDQIVLVELYPAREEAIPGISSQTLFDKIRHQNKWIVEKAGLIECLEQMELDVIMTLGAGDLDLKMNEIKELLIKRDADKN